MKGSAAIIDKNAELFHSNIFHSIIAMNAVLVYQSDESVLVQIKAFSKYIMSL